MFNISSYLEKFKKIGGDSRDLRGLCAEVCSNFCGIPVDVKDISYKNAVLRIKAPAIIKNALFIKKNQILAEIRKKNTTTWEVEDILF
ncbi:MAG: hypothetical protein WCW14_03360 [Candidatus Paceibacterota bacterium]|jgi:hypothetical protein